MPWVLSFWPQICPGHKHAGVVAALVVGMSVGIVAAILFVTGRKKVKLLILTPQETIQTLKEDVAWIRNRQNKAAY